MIAACFGLADVLLSDSRPGSPMAAPCKSHNVMRCEWWGHPARFGVSVASLGLRDPSPWCLRFRRGA